MGRASAIGRPGPLVVLVSLAVLEAEAEDSGLDVVVGVSAGSTVLAFDEKLDADTSFPSYALFGSVSAGNTYATVSYSDSVGSENISEEDELGDANRRDLDITLGYRLGEAWTAFVGYKDGETNIDFRVRDTDIVQSEYYREEGFYLGASYSLRFERAGTLSFTAAYIQFDSDLRFTQGVDLDDEEEEEPLEFDDLEGTFSGDADGFSIGVSWIMPLTASVAFRTLYKINDYQLEVDSDGMRFEPDQRLSYFEIGLLYAF